MEKQAFLRSVSAVCIQPLPRVFEASGRYKMSFAPTRREMVKRKYCNAANFARRAAEKRKLEKKKQGKRGKP